MFRGHGASLAVMLIGRPVFGGRRNSDRDKYTGQATDTDSASLGLGFALGIHHEDLRTFSFPEIIASLLTDSLAHVSFSILPSEEGLKCAEEKFRLMAVSAEAFG